MHRRARGRPGRARSRRDRRPPRRGRRSASRRLEPSSSSAVRSSLSVHQPRSRRLGSRPSKPSSPKRTKAPFSIRPTTSPWNVGASVDVGEPALEQERQADVVGGALDLHRLALGRRSVHGHLVELVRRGRGVVDAEPLQQRAVRDHVRVAPDRRREVAVARAGEPGVAEVLRRVVGLLERAQHERPERQPVARLARDDARRLRREVGGLLRRHVLRHRRRRDLRGRPAARTGTSTACGSGRSWTR